MERAPGFDVMRRCRIKDDVSPRPTFIHSSLIFSHSLFHCFFLTLDPSAYIIYILLRPSYIEVNRLHATDPLTVFKVVIKILQVGRLSSAPPLTHRVVRHTFIPLSHAPPLRIYIYTHFFALSSFCYPHVIFHGVYFGYLSFYVFVTVRRHHVSPVTISRISVRR